MSEQVTRPINTPLVEQAMLHLLAAYGERMDRDELHKKPLDFLTIVLRIAQAQGFTLEDVLCHWNDILEGKV